MQFVYNNLCIEASKMLRNRYPDFGELIAINGSLINAVLSMAWADYRKNSKKAKIHLGFNINKGIPSKIYFTNGNYEYKSKTNFVIPAALQTRIFSKNKNIPGYMQKPNRTLLIFSIKFLNEILSP